MVGGAVMSRKQSSKVAGMESKTLVQSTNIGHNDNINIRIENIKAAFQHLKVRN